eukprot:5652378-Alexandrium_andersonii.AAC.1
MCIRDSLLSAPTSRTVGQCPAAASAAAFAGAAGQGADAVQVGWLSPPAGPTEQPQRALCRRALAR